MSAKLRLLVIGANGFLGGRLADATDDRFHFIRAGRNGCELPIDIADAASVASAFETARPQIVVLAAAMADIDRCEREPAQARQTNVVGACNVAKECVRTGARLIFTSSGAVFDGTAPEYREDSRPAPLSVYGATKAEAESVIAGLMPDAVIIRLSLVLGWAMRAGTNAVLDRLRAAFEAGNTAAVPVNEYRNAIDVGTVARWILDLAAAREARGVFHLGSRDALSRYEIARGLAQAMGYPADLVVADDAPRPGRAPRGLRELLIPGRIAQFSAVPVPPCREAIERCVRAVA